MTGKEYLTPDGQQLTLDVTACVCVCVCVGGGAFLPQKPNGGGGGGALCLKVQIFRPVDKMFTF